MFQPGLRNGYAQDTFLGIEQRITPALFVDIDGLSALGRRLLSNDTLGYGLLFTGAQPGIPAGQLLTYRGSQGLSDYYALAIKARYRHSRGFLQAAYTWSHSIDNQSDPLGLDLTNFGYTTGAVASTPVPPHLVAGFLTPQDSNGDRGNSDFDERHNLVAQATFDLPAAPWGRLLNSVTRDWTIAGVGALRSGFPYTVWALGGLKGFTRANIIDPSLTREDQPAAGGEMLLNPAGFSGPGGAGEQSGRNAFTGPGFINFDFGVSRAFAVRGLPESARLILRADFFNVLNHANLNTPYNVFGGPLGFATFGLNARPATFPTPLPLAETPREVQLSIRVRF